MKSALERAQAIVSSVPEGAKSPRLEGAWPFEGDPPEDLAALLSTSDGLLLEDGTRLLGREEIGPATRWLVEEKSLAWSADLVIVGERDDLVIVRDLDRQGKRAGGGVLEAPTDGLEALARVALDLLGYLEERIGLGPDPNPAPERAVQRAAAERDARALERTLEKSFYPGAETTAAHAALVLGELRLSSNDMAGAMSAFELAASLRARAARRGAEGLERAAAWRAAARVASSIGAKAAADACLERARG